MEWGNGGRKVWWGSKWRERRVVFVLLSQVGWLWKEKTNSF